MIEYDDEYGGDDDDDYFIELYCTFPTMLSVSSSSLLLVTNIIFSISQISFLPLSSLLSSSSSSLSSPVSSSPVLIHTFS
jgi:hypothetical protein